jgi:hypothetical protein
LFITVVGSVALALTVNTAVVIAWRRKFLN